MYLTAPTLSFYTYQVDTGSIVFLYSSLHFFLHFEDFRNIVLNQRHCSTWKQESCVFLCCQILKRAFNP